MTGKLSQERWKTESKKSLWGLSASGKRTRDKSNKAKPKKPSKRGFVDVFTSRCGPNRLAEIEYWKKKRKLAKSLVDNYSQKEKCEFIRRAKQKSCMDCGVSHPTWIMDFDHRGEKIKKFTLATSHLSKTMNQIIEEIAKCDVVCSNCHRQRTHDRKVAERLKGN